MTQVFPFTYVLMLCTEPLPVVGEDGVPGGVRSCRCSSIDQRQHALPAVLGSLLQRSHLTDAAHNALSAKHRLQMATQNSVINNITGEMNTLSLLIIRDISAVKKKQVLFRISIEKSRIRARVLFKTLMHEYSNNETRHENMRRWQKNYNAHPMFEAVGEA